MIEYITLGDREYTVIEDHRGIRVHVAVWLVSGLSSRTIFDSSSKRSPGPLASELIAIARKQAAKK